MKKEVLIIGIIYFVITTGLIIYLFSNRDIQINYPPIKTSEVKIEKNYFLFELPRHEVDMLYSYYDGNNAFHQIYRDSVRIEKDSAEISWITKVDVNSDQQKAIFDYDSIKIKYYEKTVTNTIIDTLLTEKLVELPFYRDNWFWYFIIETFTFLTVFAALIFG